MLILLFGCLGSVAVAVIVAVAAGRSVTAGGVDTIRQVLAMHNSADTCMYIHNQI